VLIVRTNVDKCLVLLTLFEESAILVVGLEGHNMINVENAETLAHLPAAIFYGEAAVAEFESDAAGYEAVVKAYELDGEGDDLHDGLSRLAFTAIEIEWHVEHRGERMAIGYVCSHGR
jgi:hypothetical protein